MTDIDRALTPINQAQRMLAEAKSLPELRELRDYATAAKAWAKARGMGIGAENDAAEVILRAERSIGQQLASLAEAGKYGTGTATKGRHAKRRGVELASDEFYSPKDFGLSHDESANFQRLVAIPDDEFDQMIAEFRHAVETGASKRLAKVNFYARGREYRAPGRRIERERLNEATAPAAFVQFRDGAYALLGWEVDEDGNEGPTDNGLHDLALDELNQFVRLIQALVKAFNVVRTERGI